MSRELQGVIQKVETLVDGAHASMYASYDTMQGIVTSAIRSVLPGPTGLNRLLDRPREYSSQGEHMRLAAGQAWRVERWCT